MHTCKNRQEKPIADRICHFGLTGALVEFACLCNIPFAQSGSLANGWSHSVHIVAWQDGVQEDASVIHKARLMLMVHGTQAACTQPC